MSEPTVKKKNFRFIFKIITALVGLGIAGAATLALMVVIVYPRLPSMDELRNYQPILPLQVFSSDGVLLGQFGEERRIFISFNDTPKMLINAILSAEDERFYQHGGIDYLGVVRALGLNILSGHKQSGASTITMQVARNFFLSSKKTYSRKFNEALLSYKIENSLTKDQILELYINQIYLGQRAYGFAEAAITYFGKPLNQLSIAEYAVLAGLPKAPSAYNPVVNKKRSHERELYVLGRMKANGSITEEQYRIAQNQPIIVAKGTTRDATDSGGYVAEMVRQMLYEKYGDKIYTDGYKVNTTIDSNMQQAAYTSLRNGLLDYDAKQGYNGAEGQAADIGDNDSDGSADQVISSAFDNLSDYGDLRAAIVVAVSPDSLSVKTRDGNDIVFKGKQLDFVHNYLNSGGNKALVRGAVVRIRLVNKQWTLTQLPKVEGAIVALNPNDGSIKSLAGGFDFTRNNYNHVTQAMRQPGSSFKPFIYSSALDKGFTTNTIIDDNEICFASGGDGGGQWCPRNDDNDFLGPISLRQALTLSRNVVTVKILNQISPQYAIDYVTKFGFNKSQFQPYLTMALGASEVTPMQMAIAFSVFANGGHLITPYLIKTISDNKGNVLAKTDPTDISKAPVVIDPRNGFIMNSIMQDVVRYGTGARVYRELKRNDLAGKTGTTTDAKDVWFDGYTPNLVAITWVGYDQPKTLGKHAYGATLALPIWINFMRVALNGVPETQLAMPGGITVLHDATWKGNDEYIYDGAKPLDFNENAGINPAEASEPVKEDSSQTEASDDPGKENASSTEASPNSNQVKPITNHNSPASTPNAKPASMDDLIQNIQD